MVICSRTFGYSARLISNRLLVDMQLTRALGLAMEEELFALVCLGTAAQSKPSAKPPTPGEHLSIWKP